jgi:hypothetical protein
LECAVDCRGVDGVDTGASSFDVGLNEAYERGAASDVCFRFVIDTATI